MLTFLNRIITWSFYVLFFFVPLVFTSDTSELFELNKMWLTWGLAIIIVGAWIIKMAYEGKIRIQRTPLDIPILLFLLSQFISTIASLDPHTSFWGYYSRFNGGFLSLVTYIVLYYAFVTHVQKEHLMRYLYVILLSGVVVALWGLPSHFGYDPTCLLFRGTFDVSCWTNAFQPKVRIFSTLGQPDWLSAYLGALIPLSVGLATYFWEKTKKILAIGAFATTLLFYLDFLYAKSRGGYVGLAVAMVFFIVWFIWQKGFRFSFAEWTKTIIFPLTILGFIVITFLVGTSVSQIDHFTLPELLKHFQPAAQTKVQTQTPSPQPASPISSGEFGGTDSSKIRLFVWTGAIDAWKHYPIFGTGVETFAYAYYLFMPPGHNLTSEFGYLYNKAHNEYLNYLATTGIVGLTTYLIMIGIFLFVAIKKLRKPYQLSSTDMLLAASFLAAYVSILISNFFGFSVVIMNVFLFLFPGFTFLFLKKIDFEKAVILPKNVQANSSPSGFVWVVSGIVILIGGYCLVTLLVFWNADKAYGLGQNYVNAGDYQSAYQPLQQAVSLRPGEPTFQDETSLDDAVLGAALLTQDKTATAAAQQLSQTAVQISDTLTQTHPNIVTFWKTRVRIFYALSQVNPEYLTQALTAIQKAALLAPTDAKVSYNLGLLYGQTGDYAKAITTLQNTIVLKKDYHDAYYALGLFYHTAATSKTGIITNPELAQKGIEEMHFILQNFNPKDNQALTALKAWGAN